MASLFTDPGFVEAAAICPTMPEATRRPAGRPGTRARPSPFPQISSATESCPARPGIARIIPARAGRRMGRSRSPPPRPEESVRAVLEHAVGRRNGGSVRTRFSPGICVPAKKPDPAIYLLTMDRLGLDPTDTLVVEDSRNGLLAADRAGLGMPGHGQRLHPRGGLRRGRARGVRTRRSRTAADRGARQPWACPSPVTTSLSTTYGACAGVRTRTPRRPGNPERTSTGRYWVSDTQAKGWTSSCGRSRKRRSTTRTYFGDLDSVVGDGDFGYSLARGFEKVIEGWDDIDRDESRDLPEEGAAMIVSSRIGGTSGPHLGHRAS